MPRMRGYQGGSEKVMSIREAYDPRVMGSLLDVGEPREVGDEYGEMGRQLSPEQMALVKEYMDEQGHVRRQVIEKLGIGYASGVDSVPAMLTPGEAVLTPGAAEEVGRGKIRELNRRNPPRGGDEEFRFVLLF